jgi:predicted AAA+ superfamily ATPase
LLTGSSNVLLLPTLADSLAGRMEIVRLHPLAQCELSARPSWFLDVLFEGRFASPSRPRQKDDLVARIVAGGYPPALTRPTPARRTRWYRDYVDALVQREVQDLARISRLDALPSLLAAASRSRRRPPSWSGISLGSASSRRRPALDSRVGSCCTRASG